MRLSCESVETKGSALKSSSGESQVWRVCHSTTHATADTEHFAINSGECSRGCDTNCAGMAWPNPPRCDPWTERGNSHSSTFITTPSILASTPSGAGRPQASPWQKASPLVLDRVGPTYSHVMATSECVKPTQDHVVGSLDRVNSTLDEPLHEPAHVPQQSGNGRSPSHVQTRRARAQVLLSRDPPGFVKGCSPTRSPPYKVGAGTPGMEPTLFRERCAVT